MKKILLIGLKDVTLAFRDRAALIFMLAAPFLLTLGMGFVTGRLAGSGSGGALSDITVAVVNQDGGPAGQALVDVLQSPELSDLLIPSTLPDGQEADAREARRRVDANELAAAVIIPPGFSDSLAAPGSAPVAVELYANPTRPTASGVIRSILEVYTRHVTARQVAAEVTISQLAGRGLVQPAEAGALAERILAQGNPSEGAGGSIRLETVSSGREAVEFDILAYLAPGMALMFLMYTVSNGGRTLLAERAHGTLPRLLVAPVTPAQVLAGKVFGIFLTGAAQMFILIGASSLLFGLSWGDPLGVILLVLAAVFGAVGWGMIITALSRNPGQVAGVGSAVMLIFGILGGSFINVSAMGAFAQAFSKITPNAWGLTGFAILAGGGTLAEIIEPIAALLVMGAVLFAIAVVIITRRGFETA